MHGKPPLCAKVIASAWADGTWRSLVAHLTGGQGVAGSNPAVPTSSRVFSNILMPPPEPTKEPFHRQRAAPGVAAGVITARRTGHQRLGRYGKTGNGVVTVTMVGR